MKVRKSRHGIKSITIKNNKMEKAENILNDQLGGSLVTDKSEPLFMTTPIDGTPFAVILREGKHFVTFGQYKVSEEFETHEQAERLVLEYDYHFLINVMFAALEFFSDNAENIKEIKNQQIQLQ